MNKIKLICLASMLVTGIVQAAVPCNGFEIKVKNNLPDDLLVTSIQLEGATLQPGAIQKLSAGNEQVFTVNDSVAENDMTGDMIFYTVTLPTKKVHISFELKNRTLICQHNDKTIDGDYPTDSTRSPNKVTYTIG